MSRQDQTLVDIVGVYSEESITPGRYNSYEVDVTAEMTRRENWDQSLLVFQGVQNDVAGSFFYLDDVELQVCRTEGAATQGRAAQPQMSRAWRALGPALDGRNVVRTVIPSGRGPAKPFAARGDAPWLLPASSEMGLPGVRPELPSVRSESLGVRPLAAPVR